MRFSLLESRIIVFLGLIVILGLVAVATPSNAFAGKTTVHLPAAMAGLFEQTEDWERGVGTGWLKVREKDKEVGQVLVMLVGRSYSDPQTKGQYRVEYVGFGDNGTKHSLPKGLYTWRHPSSPDVNCNYSNVKPGLRNKYADRVFFVDLGSNEPVWFIHKDQQDFQSPQINWRPELEKYRHPSSEIARLVEE